MKKDGGQQLTHSVTESAHGGPSRGWLAATIGLCCIVGVIPFDEAPGQLTLTVRRRTDALILEIDADGPTATEAAACSQREFGGLGMGLATVERRLALLYGGLASVRLT